MKNIFFAIQFVLFFLFFPRKLSCPRVHAQSIHLKVVPVTPFFPAPPARHTTSPIERAPPLLPWFHGHPIERFTCPSYKHVGGPSGFFVA